MSKSRPMRSFSPPIRTNVIAFNQSKNDIEDDEDSYSSETGSAPSRFMINSNERIGSPKIGSAPSRFMFNSKERIGSAETGSARSRFMINSKERIGSAEGRYYDELRSNPNFKFERDPIYVPKTRAMSPRIIPTPNSPRFMGPMPSSIKDDGVASYTSQDVLELAHSKPKDSTRDPEFVVEDPKSLSDNLTDDPDFEGEFVDENRDMSSLDKLFGTDAVAYKTPQVRGSPFLEQVRKTTPSISGNLASKPPPSKSTPPAPKLSSASKPQPKKPSLPPSSKAPSKPSPPPSSKAPSKPSSKAPSKPISKIANLSSDDDSLDRLLNEITFESPPKSISKPSHPPSKSMSKPPARPGLTKPSPKPELTKSISKPTTPPSKPSPPPAKPMTKPSPKPELTKPAPKPELTKPAPKPSPKPELTKPAPKPSPKPELTKPAPKPELTKPSLKPPAKPTTSPSKSSSSSSKALSQSSKPKHEVYSESDDKIDSMISELKPVVQKRLQHKPNMAPFRDNLPKPQERTSNKSKVVESEESSSSPPKPKHGNKSLSPVVLSLSEEDEDEVEDEDQDLYYSLKTITPSKQASQSKKPVKEQPLRQRGRGGPPSSRK